MKLMRLVCVFGFCVFGLSGAFAASQTYGTPIKKCVSQYALGGTGSSGYCNAQAYYTSDSSDTYTFSMDCAGNRVDGVAVWSSYGYHQTTAACGFTGFTVDSDNLNNNMYCWCRLTYPIMTGWMMVYADSGSVYHSGGCADKCKEYLPDGGAINIAKTAGVCEGDI